MSEKKFKEALTIFAEALTVMSFEADQPQEDGSLTRQQERERCASKFNDLKIHWARDKETLYQLEELTKSAISFYTANEFDKGDCSVKDIDRILWDIRREKRDN